ncbi:unnamed protein product [Mesocestoides corti]|nr:unnamed protein product [Mesocestoides corti]
MEFAKMQYRAFPTTTSPGYTEVCPRDIQINFPVAAVTGSIIGIAIIAIFVGFGGYKFHKKRKLEKSLKLDAAASAAS